jgi:assimilatory nitrate reductase catalytic subunit
MIESTPKFLQGIFSFTGTGYTKPAPLGGLTYAVPSDKRCQAIYLRAGNSCAEMVALVLLRDGRPMRYFPVGAKADSHVALAVVEDLEPDQKLEVFLAAPEGISGTIVLDLGLMEI